jgi:tellurite resistance protein TerC
MPAMIAGMTAAAILTLLGVKMLGSAFFHVPVSISLGAVVGILAIAALALFLWPPKKNLTHE